MGFSRKIITLLLINLLTFLIVSYLFWKTVWSTTFYGNAANMFIIVNTIFAVIVSFLFNRLKLHLNNKIFLIVEVISMLLFISIFYGLLYYDLSKSSWMF